MAPVLEPGAERVVIFHLITEGECYVELADGPPTRLTWPATRSSFRTAMRTA